MFRSRIWLLSGLIPFMTLAADVKKKDYPPTRTEKLVEKLHGVEIADPYRWLEDGESKEVQQWTEKQNAYTSAILSKLPGRVEIEKRLDELLSIGRVSAAQPAKGRYFYTKREGKQNQAVLYVRDGVKGKDRVLLDPNELSKDGTIALDWWFVNDDGSLLAYGLSKDGSEESTLYLRDVKTGKDLPDQIERTRHAAVAFTPDGKGFYYTRYPKKGDVSEGDENYFRHVFYHQIGTDPATDVKVYGEGRDKEDWPNPALSPKGRYLVVTVEQGWSKSEVYLKDLKAADGKFVPVVEKKNALYGVTVRDDALYIVTNEGAPRYRVFKADPAKPGRENWVEIIKEGEDVLTGLTAVGEHLVAHYMHKASSRLRVFNRNGKLVREIDLPAIGSIEGMGAEPDGAELFFGFSSFTFPPASTASTSEKREAEAGLWETVKSNIEVDKYEVKQVTYRSKDGTPITMFIAHKKGLKLDGENPTVLTGYGGFNSPETPFFGASLFLFLERGGVLALPNLRGGGEYGEEWHQAGMLDKKQNVFDDFIAAAEYLIKEKYTSPKRLAIQGGSNGGLLVGAAIVQRPELFRACVCQVPLLDMLRYHKFRIARLWIPEYGDPDQEKDFKWLHAYSPYHHVKDGTAYPATLFTAAESDTRVDPLHARKMAARVQAATSSDQPILLRIETKAGHGAGKPRSKLIEELTDAWSFLFAQLGVKP